MFPGVELELRRLGRVHGTINLLRQPALGESIDVYAGRVELGTALIACKIGLGNANTKCGATTSDVDGRDCQLQLVDNGPVATLRESWEPKALTAVVDALLRGGCSSKARSILLKVVVALGSRVPEAGVTSQLFHILSDGIACSDTQSCRHVLNALAICLHESPKCAESTARDEERLTLLLALAFPGKIQLPRSRKRHLLPPTTLGSDSEGPRGSVVSIRDRETREYSLSCLFSAVKADEAAASTVCAVGGIRPLFVLALGDEPAFDGGDHQPGVPERTSQRRPRASSPGPLASASRKTSPPLTTSDVVGSTHRRPTTAEASNSVRRSSSESGKTASGARTAAPIADSTVQEQPLSRASDSGGGNPGSGEACPDVRQHLASAQEAQAVPSPPPPLPTDATPGKGRRGGGGDQEANLDTSAGPLLPRPREPEIGIPHGGDAARSDERVAALAAAILVACLRRKGPSRTATVEREKKYRAATTVTREGRASDGKNDNAGQKDGGIKKALPMTAAVPKAGASLSSRDRACVPPPSSSPPPPSKPNGDNKWRQTRRGSGAAAAGAGKGERKTKAAPRRFRGRKRSLSWRGRKRSRATADEDSDTPSAPTDRTPQIVEQGSPRDSKSDQSDEAGLGRYILDQAPGNGLGGKDGRSMALQRLFLDRRSGAATLEFSELERLGAGSRAPGLLDSPSQLLQELGVVILERGIEELEGGEEEDRDEEGKGANMGHGNEKLADTSAREGEIRRTSAPTTPRRTHRHRKQLLRSVVAGSGTALRSLCWLLLHRRRHVSEGAAAALLALTNLVPVGAAAPRPAPPWALHGLVEQGCVPILRMAAGRPAAAAANPPPELDCEEGGRVEAAASAAAQEAVDRGAHAGADEGGCGSVARLAARAVLEAVAEEACVRHADRLAHSVSVSGNRELRANVALAIGILSAGTAGRGAGGGKAWRSFVSGGGVSAVLGMLRSPTGRPAAVSFLRVVAALLGGVSAPPDFFAEDIAVDDGESGNEVRGGKGGGVPAGAGSSSEDDDTIVLVRDPLCLGREEGNRGGRAEAEGIKMACPPRKVIFRASPVLRRVILDTPPGELPLLHGRYRSWEEVMAHMGAPHTFAATSASYSIAFLIEMFVLAATFKIETQADGYAHEVRRRLGASPTTCADQLTNAEDAEVPVRRLPDTTAEEPLSTSSYARPEQPGSLGIAPTGTGGDVDHVRQASDESVRRCSDGSISSSGGVRRGSGVRRLDHHQAASAVFTMLEASLRCCHGWLCEEAFREAAALMGHGGGEGLPAAPRELTAVIGLLLNFLSLLWVADGPQSKGQEDDFLEQK